MASEGHVQVWADPVTGRDLVPLDQLLAIAREDGHNDVPHVLHQFMRAGAEVLTMTTGAREVVMVRMPEGWDRVPFEPR